MVPILSSPVASEDKPLLPTDEDNAPNIALSVSGGDDASSLGLGSGGDGENPSEEEEFYTPSSLSSSCRPDGMTPFTPIFLMNRTGGSFVGPIPSSDADSEWPSDEEEEGTGNALQGEQLELSPPSSRVLVHASPLGPPVSQTGGSLVPIPSSHDNKTPTGERPTADQEATVQDLQGANPSSGDHLQSDLASRCDSPDKTGFDSDYPSPSSHDGEWPSNEEAQDFVGGEMELQTPSSSYFRGLLGVSPVFFFGASLGPSPSPHDGKWPTNDEEGTLQDLLCELECSTPSSSSWRVDPGVSPPSSLVNRSGGVVADPSPELLNREEQDTVQTILLVEQEHCGSSSRRCSWPLSMVERLMLAETGEMDCFVPSNTSAKKTGVKKKSVKTTSVKKKSVKKKKKSVKKKTSVTTRARWTPEENIVLEAYAVACLRKGVRSIPWNVLRTRHDRLRSAEACRAQWRNIKNGTVTR